MKRLFYLLFLCLSLFIGKANAQDWIKIHHHYDGIDWIIPFSIDRFQKSDINDDYIIVHTLLNGEEKCRVSICTESIDSIDFGSNLPDEEKGHNKYRPFSMHITTDGYDNIVERELWTNCHISIDGKGEYSDYSGTGKIRGRGNSTWEWYDKKPYKLKLDEKSKLLGMEKAKNWNLLANYRDVTDMMNVFAFETARYMGMPYTNHTRFVEVFLNDEYIGTYQLTEKLEVGKNRINIDEEGGILLSFDQDDGPSLSLDATDNFYSSVYRLPMCVKHPDEPDEATIEKAKSDFEVLEYAIKSHNYALVDSLLDIPSFIGILQLHEYLYNVEIDAPRSIYMFRDKGGKYTFGPVWDWDAGFDFDWSDMYTGHTFFGNYRKLIYGTNPVKGTGASYSINGFWREMFNNATFVKQYKQAWADASDSIYIAPWEETRKYIDALSHEGTYDRDTQKWPLYSIGTWGQASTSFLPTEEIEKMSTWIQKRKTYLDGVISKYPNGNDNIIDNDPTEIRKPTVTQNGDGSITVDVALSKELGYSQSFTIDISQDMVTSILGSIPLNLNALNADNTIGSNTAAGTYGAWFDADGNTVNYYGDSHVYIEANTLFKWSYGCHPQNCAVGDKHTVRMQYKKSGKTLNVTINFKIQ